MEVDGGAPKKSRVKLFVLILGLVFLVAIPLVYWWIRIHDEPVAPHKVVVVSPAKAPKIQLALFSAGVPKPTSMTSTRIAGDSRLFVIDQDGIIKIIKPDGSIVDKPFLDISAQVLSSGEMGLLGLAFSPKYQKDGYFFINYIDKGQNSVISRYHVSSDSNVADPASGQTVLTLKQPYTNHNGGDLVFGPDGYLYAAFGDGGSGGDPEDRAQNLSILLGKILRLDVSQIPYKIPADNPFAGKAGQAPEIWDYGLRNPWRVSFDRKTGDFYIADVGQGKFEEVNVELAESKGGNNYGWRCYEANAEFNLAGCKSKDNYVLPALQYEHIENRCSITGGYVYRGSKYPSLQGKYFYGDYCTGDVSYMQKQAKDWKSTLAVKSPYKISVFGEDSQGELYMADYASGAIYQIQTSN